MSRKAQAWTRDSRPAGISRIACTRIERIPAGVDDAVEGHRRVLAVTIAATIEPPRVQVTGCSIAASSAPTSAHAVRIPSG